MHSTVIQQIIGLRPSLPGGYKTSPSPQLVPYFSGGGNGCGRTRLFPSTTCCSLRPLTFAVFLAHRHFSFFENQSFSLNSLIHTAFFFLQFFPRLTSVGVSASLMATQLLFPLYKPSSLAAESGKKLLLPAFTSRPIDHPSSELPTHQQQNRPGRRVVMALLPASGTLTLTNYKSPSSAQREYRVSFAFWDRMLITLYNGDVTISTLFCDFGVCRRVLVIWRIQPGCL